MDIGESKHLCWTFNGFLGVVEIGGKDPPLNTFTVITHKGVTELLVTDNPKILIIRVSIGYKFTCSEERSEE